MHSLYYKAAAINLLGWFIWSLDDVTLKYLLNKPYSLAEVTFFSGIAGTLVLCALTLPRQGLSGFATKHWKIHALRTFLTFVTYLICAYAVSGLPLTDFYAIGFLCPLGVVLWSMVLFKERPNARIFISLVLGLLAVILVFHPSGDALNRYGMMMLFSTLILGSWQTIIVKYIDTPEPTVNLGIYVNLAMVICALPFIGTFVMPEKFDWFLLFATGCLNTGGMVLVAKSYHMEDASKMAPFHYSQLLWGIVFGLIFWSQAPDAWSLLGGALVMAAGLIALKKNHTPNQKETGPFGPAS